MDINIIQVDGNCLINNEIDNFYKVYFSVIINNLSFNNESIHQKSLISFNDDVFRNSRKEVSGPQFLRAIQFSIANF